MIANDSIGFTVSENRLTCHIKVTKFLSIMDLYDIFKVLGMLRICSWQDFSIFAKPKVFSTEEYLSLFYSKKELDIKLISRYIVDKQLDEEKKKKKKPETPVWADVIVVMFKEEPKDLEDRLRKTIKKINDDYDFVHNLWSFKFEQSDGSYVTDQTIIDPGTFRIDVRHNIDLLELIHDYLSEHPAQLYKLFNESVKWQMETACETVPDDEFDEEEFEENYEEEYEVI